MLNYTNYKPNRLYTMKRAEDSSVKWRAWLRTKGKHDWYRLPGFLSFAYFERRRENHRQETKISV